ncbi:MAG: hypothetical protein LBF22_12820 [Deltaproteobacteria bacterium]|nr:hypothetical protein [Deltaproteobacteria bacterium]
MSHGKLRDRVKELIVSGNRSLTGSGSNGGVAEIRHHARSFKMDAGIWGPQGA